MNGLLLATILILTMVFVVGIVLLYEIKTIKKDIRRTTMENICEYLSKENTFVRKRNCETLTFYSHVSHNLTDKKDYIVIDIND